MVNDQNLDDKTRVKPLSKVKLVRFNCNLRELRARDSRLTEEAVATAAGMTRATYHAMEMGCSDALTQRKKPTAKEKNAGLEPRIKRIATALGVDAIDIVCVKLDRPYILAKQPRTKKPAPRVRKLKPLAIKKQSSELPKEAISAKDYRVATILRVLEKDTLPGLTLEEFVLIVASVYAEYAREDRESPHPLTLGETQEIVKRVLTVIAEERRSHANT